MSEEGSFWMTLAEKFFGLLLLAVGALSAYYTVTSVDVLGSFTGFFGFLSIALSVLGIFLIIARTE